MSAPDAERRLAFGRVAELYERERPEYPRAALDELVQRAGLTPGSPVLEVGAGTGKLTRALAGYGLAVTAVEPDAAMAALARRATAGSGDVVVQESEFETWRVERRYRALVSAQAWHWIDPAVRLARAADALERGGTLAALWTLPAWERIELREALSDAYRRTVPELEPFGPMHPASARENMIGDWRGEIDASADFERPAVSIHGWRRAYSTERYLGMIQTHQDHIRLADEQREALLAALAEVLDGSGGGLRVEFETLLCLAERR